MQSAATQVTDAPAPNAQSAHIWRNTAAIGISRVAAVALDGLAFILTVRYFGPSDYGVYLAVLAFLNLIDIAADMTTFDVAVREMSVSPGLMGNWLGAVSALRLALAAAGVLAFLVYVVVTGHLRNDIAGIAVSSLVMIVGALRSPLTVFRAEMKMHYELAIIVSTRLVNILAVLLLIQWQAGVVAFLAGILASRAFLAIFSWVCVFRSFKVKLAFEWRRFRELVRECVPMGVSGLFVAVQFKVDILLLASLSTATAAGLYGSIAQLPEYSLYGAVIISTPMLPVLSQAFADTDSSTFNALVQRMLLAMLTLLAPLIVAGLMMPEQVVTILFGQQYAPIANVFPLLVLSITAIWISHAMAVAAVAAHLQRAFIWIQSVCVVLYLGLNTLAIPAWGTAAAAGTRLLTCVLAPVLTWWVITRRVDLSLPLRRLGPVAVGAGAMAVIFAALSNQPLWVPATIGSAAYAATLILMYRLPLLMAEGQGERRCI